MKTWMIAMVLVCAACGGTAGQAGAGSEAQAAPLPPARQLTVVVEGGGRVVSVPPGLDCAGGTCVASFADSVPVELTATANPSWSFAGYGVGCEGPKCHLTLEADTKVYAHFDPAH